MKPLAASLGLTLALSPILTAQDGAPPAATLGVPGRSARPMVRGQSPELPKPAVPSAPVPPPAATIQFGGPPTVPAAPMTTYSGVPAAPFVDYGAGAHYPAIAAPSYAEQLSRPRWEVSGEYLMWWTKTADIPVLASTGPAESDGILGRGGVPIYGGGSAVPSLRAGFRVRAGTWFDDERKWGLDASFFFLGDRGRNFSRFSYGDQVLARPFFDNENGRESSEVIASPGQSRGGISIKTDSFLWGAELNAKRRLWETCCDGKMSSGTLLFGYRYLDLRERLEVAERFEGLPTGTFPNESGFIIDSFRTSNQFNGGQIGLAWHRGVGRWHFDATPKIALGSMNQQVQTFGFFQPIGPLSSPASAPGGLLTTNSNIGTFSRSRVAFIPEVTLNVGYDVTPHLRAFVGYNFLYVSSVVRPGDQVDRIIDPSRLPVPAALAGNLPPANTGRPLVPFKATDFWAQGINFGLKYTW